MQHYSDWVDDKVLRFSRPEYFLLNSLNLPPEFVPKEHKVISFILSDLGKTNFSAQASNFNALGGAQWSIKTADGIKITATGGVLSVAKSGQNPQFTNNELEGLISIAKDYGLWVAAHAHGKEGMLRAVNAGVTSIEHGTFMDGEVMDAMKKNGTYYVPTILAGEWVAEKSKIDNFFPELVRPKAAKIGPQILDTFTKAHKYGVKIAFGTDSGVSAHGDNWQEFALMVKGGMSPLETIQSATLETAKLFRLENEIGKIKTGFSADIIALRDNPLENIESLKDISFVMKEGTRYK